MEYNFARLWMTKGEEQEFVLLASLATLGGSPSRFSVLEFILEKGLLNLTQHDLEPNRSRNESRWRTDLSYLRNDLKERGMISAERKGYWRITDTGRQHLKELAESVLTTRWCRVLSVEAVIIAEEFAWEPSV